MRRSAHRGGAKVHYTKRLSDRILIAFHHACDLRDIETAWDLLHVLELMLKRAPRLPDGENRRARESLVAAHERLWHIQHHSWWEFELACARGESTGGGSANSGIETEITR